MSFVNESQINTRYLTLGQTETGDIKPLIAPLTGEGEEVYDPKNIDRQILLLGVSPDGKVKPISNEIGAPSIQTVTTDPSSTVPLVGGTPNNPTILQDSSKANQIDLDNEVTRAEEAETTINSRLSQEITRSTAADETLATELQSEINRAQTAEATMANNLTNLIADETSRAITAEGDLSTRIDAMEGLGGALPFKNLGSSDVLEQRSIIEYSMQSVWGKEDDKSQVFTYNETDPGASTMVFTRADDSTETRNAREVFNGTWFRNSFDNHKWVLVNTPNTNPSVYRWEDVGVDAVGWATSSTGGISKIGADIIHNSSQQLIVKDGVITYAKLADNLKNNGWVLQNPNGGTLNISEPTKKFIETNIGDEVMIYCQINKVALLIHVTGTPNVIWTNIVEWDSGEPPVLENDTTTTIVLTKMSSGVYRGYY